MIDSTFWRGKRVFITGNTGFKGSWLSIWLAELGAEIHGYALDPPTEPSLYRRAKISEIISETRGDIRDSHTLAEAMREFKPEIVLHLAAQPIVRESYKDPLTTYATNIIGTANLLEAVRRCPSVRVVLNITTDKVYKNREWCWGYREDEELGGYDPYSASKACSELITASYRASFFNPAEAGKKHNVALATARAGNVIGGGDWAPDRIVPDCIRAFSASERLRLRNPNSIRPWQHVLEPLSGYLLLCERLYHHPAEFSQGWNFGPGDDGARSVAWIVEKIRGQWPGSLDPIIDEGEQPHEANFLKLDISKARNRLGWVPLWDLETALRKTIEWHFESDASQDWLGITRKQIAAYTQSPRILDEER